MDKKNRWTIWEHKYKHKYTQDKERMRAKEGHNDYSGSAPFVHVHSSRRKHLFVFLENPLYPSVWPQIINLKQTLDTVAFHQSVVLQ